MPFQTIPLIMDGKDVVAMARTGTVWHVLSTGNCMNASVFLDLLRESKKVNAT